jgi:hypothetical protein
MLAATVRLPVSVGAMGDTVHNLGAAQKMPQCGADIRLPRG